MNSGEFERALGQFDCRQAAQVILEHRTQVRCSGINATTQWNRFASEAEEIRRTDGQSLEARGLSPKENLSTRQPQPGRGAADGVPTKLFRQPVGVFCGERFGLASISAAWNGDPGTTFAIDEEPVSTGQRIAVVGDGWCVAGAFAGIMDVPLLCRWPQEFELERLHAMPERKESFIRRNEPGLTATSMPSVFPCVVHRTRSRPSVCCVWI